MARFESSGVVDRPVEEVWNWILTAENFPKWNALRGRSKAWSLSDGPIGIGSTMVLAAHVGPFKLEQMMRIIGFEPYRTLVFEAEGGLGSRLTT